MDRYLPFPPNATKLWQTALGELQLQMTKATFDTWVKPTFALSFESEEGEGGTLIVGVRNTYAKQWLENRLYQTIERTLKNLAGRAVQVQFVMRGAEAMPHAFSAPSREGKHAMLNEAPRRERGELATPDPAPEHSSAPEHSTLEHSSAPESSTRERTEGGTGRMMEPPLPRRARENRLAEERLNGPALNPKYTFENYIVGNSNRLAHAACIAVASKPAEAYNPLFIYGGTGLGKTHLLEAVGWVPFLQGKVVVYVSSETFTNDMVNSIRNQTTEEFRQAYRQADVLLIDDIQFLAGKESTQEEFFHTFNSLHSANKQIVISSDRHPRAIATLEERLRSRFEGGLIADIQPPDLETRIAILRFKAEGQPAPVPDAVVEFIARKVQSNVREMSGALTRCVAYAQLMNLALTVELATAVLQDILQHQSVSAEQVLDAVAEYYRTTLEDLKGRSRSKENVTPRQMAMYLLREETDASLPLIGEILGGRDHTTVMYSVDKIAVEIDTDDQRRREMLAIKERIYQGHRSRAA